MKIRSRSATSEPTMMIHHVREIQIRFLIIAVVLIIGMAVGYIFHEPLFAFIKAPLNGPLHYTSPAGSLTFVINICLLIGVITTLPVAVYNLIMFAQPALKSKLSKVRIYTTTFFSLLLAAGGAAFAFLIIIPLALRFFYKFQVDGLVALISADDYLRFVVNVIITFVLIFQLPLLISFIDHLKPLSPKKLFKAEKYIIVGSIAIAVVVPFALDPMVQFLIASPIIVLYNISIGVIILQHAYKRRFERKKTPQATAQEVQPDDTPKQPAVPVRSFVKPAAPVVTSKPVAMRPRKMQDISPSSRTLRPIQQQKSKPLVRPSPAVRVAPRPQTLHSPRLISDIRPLRTRPQVGSALGLSPSDFSTAKS